MFAVAWYVPAIDMGGDQILDVHIFWAAVLIGLLASGVVMAIRQMWRRSRG